MRIACAALGGFSILLASLNAAAPNWNVVRQEGRDYLTLGNIAQFYGFPAPAPLPIIEPGTTTTPSAGASSIAAPPPVVPPEPVPPPPDVAVETAPKWVETEPTSTPPFSTVPSDPVGSAVGGAAGVVISPPPRVIERPVEEAGPTPPPVQATGPVQLPKTILLDSGKWQLEVTLNSREVMINGVKQWLAFPAIVQGSDVLISRLDLSRVIEPQLRPELIQGFRPVNTIVLDAGHGGHDKGAISRYGYEKDFALDVSTRARKLLEARGYKVAMTRTTDVFIPLHERARFAKAIPDSIFVSIHFNASSSNRDARGFEIFSIAPRGAPATNDGVLGMRDMREEPGNANELQSSALAASIYHSLLGQVPMIDRGLKHARFAVLRLATVPAVLIECGFVSNSAESALIGSPAWRERVAQAIVEGIGEYKSLAELKQRPKMMVQYRNAGSKEDGAASENSSSTPR